MPPNWFLNPALTRFRNEVNSRWPRRDKTSDGTIGDLAHQATSSDHNPDKDGSVDAWDMDNNGVDVTAVINAALRHESIQYVIYNRRITSRTWGLGIWRPYTGTSPHTEHVHFNTRESHENSTKPWFTEDDIEGEEMTALEGKDLQKVTATNMRFESTVAMKEKTPITWDIPDVPGNYEDNLLVAAVARIDKGVSTLQEGTPITLSDLQLDALADKIWSRIVEEISRLGADHDETV